MYVLLYLILIIRELFNSLTLLPTTHNSVLSQLTPLCLYTLCRSAESSLRQQQDQEYIEAMEVDRLAMESDRVARLAVVSVYIGMFFGV